MYLHTDGRVIKPRPLCWEALFLSPVPHPFKRALAEAFRKGGCPSPMEVLPSLNFTGAELLVPFTAERSVDFLSLSPLAPGELSLHEVELIGSVVGLCVWFGIADLHHENMALGRDGTGNLRFGPLDIECVLEDLDLPSQSNLVPGKSMRNPHQAGLGALKRALGGEPRLEISAALLGGYLGALEALRAEEGDLAVALWEAPGFSDWPIRIILRPTNQYADVLENRFDPAALVPGLLEAERTQLAAKDYPCFYRRAGARGLFWITPSGVEQPLEVDPTLFPHLDICTPLAPQKFIRRRNPGLASTAGGLQLLRFLEDIHPEKGVGRHKGCTVTWSRDTIGFQSANGPQLEARRRPGNPS